MPFSTCGLMLSMPWLNLQEMTRARPGRILRPGSTEKVRAMDSLPYISLLSKVTT